MTLFEHKIRASWILDQCTGPGYCNTACLKHPLEVSGHTTKKSANISGKVLLEGLFGSTRQVEPLSKALPVRFVAWRLLSITAVIKHDLI